MKKQEYKNRGFLNEQEGLAAFAASVTFYTEDVTYGTFQITDCNRKIELDFNYENEESKKNSLYKIDTLISELSIFRKKLIGE